MAYRLSFFAFICLFAASAIFPVFAATDQIFLAKVSVDEAARNVNRDQRNRILGAKTKIIEGREVHVIKTLSNQGRIRNRSIDAQTGKTLKKYNKK
jgi:hypothetical protein